MVMNPILIELDWGDLLWTLGLLGAAIALSAWQRLGLTGQLFWAGGRTLLQLLVVGYFLAVVFALNNPGAVLLVLAIMTSIAAIVAKNRIETRGNLLPWLWLTIASSTALTLSYSLAVIIQPPSWYSPQYLIPLAGMVLGNSMNSASLVGERLVSLLHHNPQEIETYLSLGASPQQAIATYRNAAIRAGLMPTLNQMMVVGIVSLPGMFTGQVLAGSDPLNAASYQILILLMILLTNLLTTLWVSEGVYRQFFNAQWQLVG